jgi:ankyrin repeat protein
MLVELAWLVHDHLLADNGHLEILLMLFKKCTEKHILTSTDNRGNTLLHLSALKDRIACARYLLQIGADPCVHNSANKTPLDIAVTRRHTEMAIMFNGGSGRDRRNAHF